MVLQSACKYPQPDSRVHRSCFFPKVQESFTTGCVICVFSNVPLWHHNAPGHLCFSLQEQFHCCLSSLHFDLLKEPHPGPNTNATCYRFCQGRHHFQVPSPVLVICCCVINHYNSQWLKLAQQCYLSWLHGLSWAMPWFASGLRGLYSRLELGPGAGTWLLHLACLSKDILPFRASLSLSPSGRPSFLSSSFFLFGCAPQLAEILVPRPGNDTRPLAVKVWRLLGNQRFKHGFSLNGSQGSKRERVKDANFLVARWAWNLDVSLSLHLTDERL